MRISYTLIKIMKEKNTRGNKTILYFLICLFSFFVLAFLVRFTSYFPIDLAITKWIQQIDNPVFALLMQIISEMGYAPQIGIIIGGIVCGLYLVGLRWEAVVALTNGLSITFIGLALKEVVQRPRPDVGLVRVFTHLENFSFPSLHILLYTAFFGYLFFIASLHLKKSIWRLQVLILLGSLIVLIGPSRIYLGAHWASDLLGGYLLGSAWLILVIHFYQWGKKRFFL